MAENMKQQAAAELSIAIGHLNAALHLWSPGRGLTPAEEKANSEVLAWRKLLDLVSDVEYFHKNEGPGA
jgi:hypothetical protein